MFVSSPVDVCWWQYMTQALIQIQRDDIEHKVNISVVLLFMEGPRALRFKQKYIDVCSDDERGSCGNGTTSGWVINYIIFSFGWTNFLSAPED